ncbi:HAD family hydrolase [Sulfidibacter corallicola]|uniref:HAD family hydrolase n=1 Tax=Sulfidibacter corallicola TaxID=2818388 RepID=A0A8A4TZI5_SULCO|nr:HAD family hydrolase [Sulfidibacter corallicola]QTD54342.1 HAD family hydrolase [Sulfidibacter corallicola]
MERVLVFDLDDTLYPERDFVKSGFGAVDAWLHEHRGGPDFFEPAWRLFERGERGTIFNQVLDARGVDYDRAFIRQLVEVYRSHRPDIQLHPDGAAALERLGRTHVLGLITDGFLETQRNKVAALGIEPVFRCIVYSDEGGREAWKPSQIPYRRIMDGCEVTGERCIYVGDNPTKDFVTAKKLGWLTIQILRSDGEYRNLDVAPEFRAHHRIESLDRLDVLL